MKAYTILAYTFIPNKPPRIVLSCGNRALAERMRSTFQYAANCQSRLIRYRVVERVWPVIRLEATVYHYV